MNNGRSERSEESERFLPRTKARSFGDRLRTTLRHSLDAGEEKRWGIERSAAVERLERLEHDLYWRYPVKTQIARTTTETKTRQSNKSQIDRPENLGKPQMKWGSDVVAEVTRRLDLKYIALVPGASYRGFHDSIVNYLGNSNPQMVICLHEEHAVSIADGYGKVTEEPMAVALHANVGLMHASMPIFNAWCDRTPMIIFGATGPVDAHRRRPWIDWIHTSKDQASIVRDYTKWDDQPASAQAAVESVLRANQITRSAPYGPVYICLDAGLQESSLAEEILIPDAARFAPAPSPAAPRDSVLKALKAIDKAKFPLILMGRVSRKQADWDRRVRFAEAIGAAVLTSSNDPAAFPTTHPLHFAAPCLRPSKAATALIEKADLIISLDWLDLAGVLRIEPWHSADTESRGQDDHPLFRR